jgi:hypothetical protein
VKPTLCFVIVSLSPGIALAQGPPAVMARSIARSAAAPAPAGYTQSTLVMIENRARTLGQQASASGEKYFVVKDADLAGKTPEEIIRRLSPSAIGAGDHVREMNILVELDRPLTILASPGDSVNVGTATVEHSIRQIDVRSIILANGITIVNK